MCNKRNQPYSMRVSKQFSKRNSCPNVTLAKILSQPYSMRVVTHVTLTTPIRGAIFFEHLELTWKVT